jgi:hypothetical protein
MFVLKILAGFIIGSYFGRRTAAGETSQLMGLSLTVMLTLIVCMAIDYVGGV